MVAGPGGFRFYLSNEIDSEVSQQLSGNCCTLVTLRADTTTTMAQIQVRINHYRDTHGPADQQHTALYVEAELSGHGMSLGQAQRTAFAQLQTDGGDYRWHSILTFPQKVDPTLFRLAWGYMSVHGIVPSCQKWQVSLLHKGLYVCRPALTLHMLRAVRAFWGSG